MGRTGKLLGRGIEDLERDGAIGLIHQRQFDGKSLGLTQNGGNLAPGLEGVEVPRLLLQPLVENALRHGLPDGRGNLTVEVVRQGTQLLYTVSDDGVGIGDTRINPGTGLSNVARRLELLFPGTHTFTLAAGHPAGTVVTVSFPVA